MKLTDKISPSMMCADLVKWAETIDVFENNKIEYLHIDIMDGNFVPNFTLGTDYCKKLKEITKIPLDIHLMIDEPEKKLDWFEFGNGDFVSVHAESTKHIEKALAEVKKRGAKAMLAINPGTPWQLAENVLHTIDGILIMTVNPGFAGQKLVGATLKKIEALRKYLDESSFENVEIEVDGNVSFENAKLMKKAGANIFVVGSSSIFSSDFTLNEGIKRFRNELK